MFHIRMLCSGEVSSKRHPIEFTCVLFDKTGVSIPTTERMILAERRSQLHTVGNMFFLALLSSSSLYFSKEKARTRKGRLEEVQGAQVRGG